jgi:hypothetical protein
MCGGGDRSGSWQLAVGNAVGNMQYEKFNSCGICHICPGQKPEAQCNSM